MTPEYKALYKSERWKRLRKSIIERDGRCVNCRSEEFLEVHHKKYTGSHPADSPKGDLVTLCECCHRGLHSGTNPCRMVVRDED